MVVVFINRFFEKLFMAILFTLRVFARNLLRGNRRKNTFRISFWCLAWDSNFGFSSNKPTHYLLDHGDLMWDYYCKFPMLHDICISLIFLNIYGFMICEFPLGSLHKTAMCWCHILPANFNITTTFKQALCNFTLDVECIPLRKTFPNYFQTFGTIKKFKRHNFSSCFFDFITFKLCNSCELLITFAY